MLALLVKTLGVSYSLRIEDQVLAHDLESRDERYSFASRVDIGTHGQPDQSEISDGLRHACGCVGVLKVFAV